jgi:hypothetical protein
MSKRIFLITFFIFTLFVISFSQTGTIRGHVHDRGAGVGLFAAEIFVKGIARTALTDFDGNFRLDSVPIGVYDITVHYFSYGDTTVIGIGVAANTVTEVNFILGTPCINDLHAKSKKCPFCGKKNKVVPIVYGLVIGEQDVKRYYYAGCEITNCDPHWYCRRDKHKF